MGIALHPHLSVPQMRKFLAEHQDVPLSEEEKQRMLGWAQGRFEEVRSDDLYLRSFTTLLLLEVGFSTSEVVIFLKNQRLYRRQYVEKLQSLFSSKKPLDEFRLFLRECADRKLNDALVSYRHESLHLYLTLAKNKKEWREATQKIIKENVGLLPHKLIERLMEECPHQEVTKEIEQEIIQHYQKILEKKGRVCDADMEKAIELLLLVLSKNGNILSLQAYAKQIKERFSRLPAKLDDRISRLNG